MKRKLFDLSKMKKYELIEIVKILFFALCLYALMMGFILGYLG